MPLNDLADYTGDFFLANADMALRSREETTMGKGYSGRNLPSLCTSVKSK